VPQIQNPLIAISEGNSRLEELIAILHGTSEIAPLDPKAAQRAGAVIAQLQVKMAKRSLRESQSFPNNKFSAV